MNFYRIKKNILDRSLRHLYFDAFRLLSRGTDSGKAFTSVFTLSTGRVGTETLAALFELTGEFFTYHEPTPKLYKLSTMAYESESDPLAKKILTNAFLTAREELLEYSLTCGRGYIETSPQVTFLAPMILEALPNARFIHLIRDPHDVIRSGMRRKWFDGHPYDKTRITPKPESPEFPKWSQYTPFQKNIWLWSETNMWIADFLQQLPDSQKFLLHSEDLFSLDENTVKRLFNFIGAPVPPKRKLHHILSKKLNAQITGAFPSTTEWTQDAKEDLRNMGAEALDRFGYPY